MIITGLFNNSLRVDYMKQRSICFFVCFVIVKRMTHLLKKKIGLLLLKSKGDWM